MEVISEIPDAALESLREGATASLLGTSSRRLVFSGILVLGLVLLAAAALFLEPLEPAGYSVRWLHDFLWLPLVGHGFYAGAPWSLIGVLTLLLFLFTGWIAWVVRVQPLNLPIMGFAWFFLGYLQPSGALLLRLKAWQRRALNPLLRGRERQTTSEGITACVAEWLIRRDEEALRNFDPLGSARFPGGTGSGGPAPVPPDHAEAERLRQVLITRLRARLLFLANDAFPEPPRPHRYAADDIARCALTLSRAWRIAGAGDAASGIRDRFHATAGIYYRKFLSESDLQPDAALRALRWSASGRPEGFRRAVPIADLLLRHTETGVAEWLEIASAPLRQALLHLWNLTSVLQGWHTGWLPPYRVHELRRTIESPQLAGLSHLGLGDVLELWLEALIRREEFEAAGRWGRIALELAEPRLSTHLRTIERLRWPGPDRQGLASLLTENRVARPEVLRAEVLRAWLGVRRRTVLEPLQRYASSQALGVLFEQGDVAWISLVEGTQPGPGRN
ncbi:MAG: hypothetical protein HYU36_17360 [Planctomycetes bacterium]|nr:hypothetical protein [Planctomycetota bacterium]